MSIERKTIFQQIMDRVEKNIKIRNIEPHSLVRAQVIAETRTPETPNQKSASGNHNHEFNMVVTGFESVERAFNRLAGLPEDDLLVTNALSNMVVRTANQEGEYNRNHVVGNMYQNAKSDIPALDRDFPTGAEYNADAYKTDQSNE